MDLARLRELKDVDIPVERREAAVYLDPVQTLLVVPALPGCRPTRYGHPDMRVSAGNRPEGLSRRSSQVLPRLGWPEVSRAERLIRRSISVYSMKSHLIHII